MLSLIERAFTSFKRVGEGLKTVLMHSFREPITGTYPDVVGDSAPLFRGRLALNVNPDTGEHLCISCRQCERVCPDKCIEIVAHKSPETNKLELIDFKIDHGLCMFCGLCTEVCPTNCIINTQDFEMADYSRESLIYDLKRLTLSIDESQFYFDSKEIPKPKPKPAKPAPGAAAAAGDKAAGAAAKAAPAAGAAAKAVPGKAEGATAKAGAAEGATATAGAAAEGASTKSEAVAAGAPSKAEAVAEGAPSKAEAKAEPAKAETKAEEPKTEAKSEEPKADGEAKSE